MFVLEEDSCESSIKGWLEPLEVEPQAAHILQSLGGCIQSLFLMTFADLKSIGVFNTDF